MGALTLTVLILAFMSRVFADVRFLMPFPGQVVSIDQPLIVTWEDDGQFPNLDQLKHYDLKLCTQVSNDTDIISLTALVLGANFTEANGTNVTVSLSTVVDEQL
jgi:uncharacterized membrane protein YozB (DUF420 family)